MVHKIEDIYSYLRYTSNLISKSQFRNLIVLKGGSVLRSKLIECNRLDLDRLTYDIDIHCDRKEVWIKFYSTIESILNQNDAGYKYRIISRRSQTKGLDTSDSLRFELDDNGKIIKFDMDMNIKSNAIITIDYSPILNMNTYDLETMLSDKIVVVSSKSIFRRIKDLYDIAVLASISNYSYQNLINHIKIKHPEVVLTNMLVNDNTAQLFNAYDKFTGIYNKPSFETLMMLDTLFLEPFYRKYRGELLWNSQISRWIPSDMT